MCACICVHLCMCLHAFSASEKVIENCHELPTTVDPPTNLPTYLSFFLSKIILFTHLFRENEHEQGEDQRERESQTDSTLSVEPHVGLNLTTLKS